LILERPPRSWRRADDEAIAFISRRTEACLVSRTCQLLWRKAIKLWSWLKLELTSISFFVKEVVVQNWNQSSLLVLLFCYCKTLPT